MDNSHDTAILKQLAKKAMVERGLLPDFSAPVWDELKRIQSGPHPFDPGLRDLRSLLWCSIDNDDSHDLDQVTVAEALPSGSSRLYVAIADVDFLVHAGGPIDQHAQHNTTSVYTPALIFPMLPEMLSTDLTSLNPQEDRQAIVIEMVIGPEGEIEQSDVYQAIVRNQAQLTYNAVAAWLEGGDMPEGVRKTPNLAANLRLQDDIARRLKNVRRQNGALVLETLKAHSTFVGEQIEALDAQTHNRAQGIIEDFMIAANGVTARFLAAHALPSIRRVVVEPKRWERIVELAQQRGYHLPQDPDPQALNLFLVQEKVRDALRFPDLSLTVVKLLGSGEYRAEAPGDPGPGHFGLAVRDYNHSTAPNRRYPDLLTMRLLKAALHHQPAPYTLGQLQALAQQCTQQEDAANKVERQMDKSAAALLYRSKIGQRFDALVTGASEKGTWVRLLEAPVEGKLVEGYQKLDVGDRVRVQLLNADVERGFIDFKKV